MLRRGLGTHVHEAYNSMSIEVQYFSTLTWARWLTRSVPLKKCAELNSEAVRAAMRRTKLKELLDSGTHSSAPVTSEMIEPPLDHVSHTLPERRDNLSLILNPKEVKAADSTRGKSGSRVLARAKLTVWNCVSQACAVDRYTCQL